MATQHNMTSKSLIPVALLALAACAAHSPDIGPDASVDAVVVVVPDAQPQPPPLTSENCNMGTLPNSRTTTIVDGDPISGNLIDEIQDCIIGLRRKAYSRVFYPSPLIVSGGPFTCVANPVNPAWPPAWKAAALGSMFATVPVESGEIITGIDLDSYSPGVGDIKVTLTYSTTMGAGSPVIGAAPVAQATPAGGWNRYAFPIVIAIPHVVADGESILAEISTGTANQHFGPLILRLAR